MPTVRLKTPRDGIEDYEYLAMLSRLDTSEQAARVVRRLTDSRFQWDKDPAAYEKTRVELAKIIEATTQGGASTSSRISGPLTADAILCLKKAR